MTIRRATQAEILNRLKSGEYVDLVDGWVVFDNVDGRWKFLATSSFSTALDPPGEKYQYVPSIAHVESSVTDGFLEVAGMRMVHEFDGVGRTTYSDLLFFMPVGRINRVE